MELGGKSGNSWTHAHDMKFVNLISKHPVVVHNSSMGDQEVVIPIGGEARVDSRVIRIAAVRDDDTGVEIPLVAFDLEQVRGLPEPKEGVIYIVSKVVREAFPHRLDLASPDVTSNEAIFKDGAPYSVPGFVVNKGE